MTQPATLAPPAPPKKRRRFFVIPADWSFYSRMVRAFEEKAGYRLAYDRGRLEIMAPISLLHDDGSSFLSDMVVVLAEEFGLPLKRGGSVTLRRRKKQKGIEADATFWIANAPRMAGVKDLDLKIHPPPDLAIEVDVSRSSLDRMGIYAAIGVPELWRLDGDELRFYWLGNQKRYVEATTSRSFPLVSSADLVGFALEARLAGDQTPVMRRFREWVRERMAKTTI